MRKFLALILIAAGFAHAATLSPIQLLNPAGSTAGQAIVSTGPSGAPVWGTAAAAAISGNAVVGNTAGAPAVPFGVSVPSCSTANSALKWTTNTGFSCGTTFALTSGNLSQFAATTSAQLAGVLSDETGTGVAVFGTSPTITTPNIVGTATNNNAAAGSVGEFPSNQATVALTTGTSANCTSVNLSAGDFDVEGNVEYVAAGGTTTTVAVTGINDVSATGAAVPFRTINTYTAAAGSLQSQIAPVRRYSLASTTTIYLVAFANFSGGTLTANCFIRARRLR
ncbi:MULTISPECIES: hypothetical protein [unclassified Cupriavidus]|uniref:hypothetical protein n=1 Tax=unclassified Cupriavidus TaxID=2640874 RepID=UPI00313BFB79